MKLPVEFVTYTRRLLGEETYNQFEEALQMEPVTSLRINPQKAFVDVASSSVHLTSVPWASEGYYASERPTFTFDPLFHAGCYYVQEASSMFVEQVLRCYVSGPSVMLDLCAAPGGKSTHARSTLPEGSLLVSNEVMRQRVQILAENMVKWGYPDVVVTNNDPADFGKLKHFFDVILTDVPCSGEGMFRKDSVAVDEWSPENVTLCWQRQRRIVADVWDSLKPGGIFIYSTCTFNLHEDEENIEWMMSEFGAEPLDVPVQPEWNITSNLAGTGIPVYRFLPHRTQGEGFFLAALRKPSDEQVETCEQRKDKKKNRKLKAPVVPLQCKEWLLDSSCWEWMCKGEYVVAIPLRHKDKIEVLQQQLKVIHAGVEVCELKGKDCVPLHGLSMSTALAENAFPVCELSYEQAIAYLRKEALQLESSLPRGYVLVTYKGAPLGFVKHLGNRANNLYPAEWRIRSGYYPEKISCL